MAIAGYIRMPVMACVEVLSNGIAIEMSAFAFASASPLGMLTDIAPFFNEMFTGWRVLFLTSEPGTLGVRFSTSAPSPGISRIRSSAIQVGLESTLSAGLPFGWNSDWRYSLQNRWNALLKAGIWVWGKQRFKGSYARNYDFDEMEVTRFTNGSTFTGGRIKFRTAPEEPSMADNLGVP
jgi:hypothetical protein